MHRPERDLRRPPGAAARAFGSLEGKLDVAAGIRERVLRLYFLLGGFGWLRSVTSPADVIKGIQTAEDGALCAAYGVDALVVSNLGGHAAEERVEQVKTLPEVVDAVEGALEVYVDGGLRRGVDVLKCLAAGARAVLVGRAVAGGLR